MKISGSRLFKLAGIGVLAGIVGGVLGQELRAQSLILGQPTPPSSVSYSGQATVVNLGNIHNFPSPIVICDTGPLPASGGTLESTVLDTNVNNGALTFDTADAISTGDGPEAQSSCAVNNFDLVMMAADGTMTTLHADFIASEATTTCKQNGHVSVNASVDIEGLVVNGQKINVNGRPNQILPIPDGQIIINQQTSSVSGSSGEMTVVALQIQMTNCLSGPVCSSHADISCVGGPPPPPSECGKLTGGGWIVGTPSGAKGTFAVSGGIRRGEFWGHLNYIDHDTGMHVTSTAVTGFMTDPNDSDCRDITYNVSIDGVPGTAYVVACDKGEPGINDTFSITLSNGYSARGDLGGAQPGGGNIQLHKCPPGWVK
ncbi:MAG TPA: choice-of-anchor P family protein [Candidatus Angelobacter sp.]|nr:choice-of-anchor P family protein [Candidatus Angelobacter sp.]